MTTEAQSIADLALKGAGAPIVIKTEAGREYLVTPEGVQFTDVTEPYSVDPNLPHHIIQGVVLQTVDSLVDYANRFKVDDTVLFADMQSSRISALIDYHGHQTPDFVQHRAVMDLPHSEEWRLWTGQDGKLVDQLAFARFIEENGGDIEEPSGADVLDAMRDLQAHRKVNFVKAVRTSSDNENFEYTDETNLNQKGGLEIPTRFKLNIPVYFGEAPTGLYAYLRWKLDDGHLHLGIRLSRPEFVRQAVFKQIVLDAAARTELPAMFGKLS
jgi:uncharacterized protein YfdQ (DUF2303 family)